MDGIAFLLLAYFIGSLPFGYMLARAKGIGDVRKMGSGNIGATNVFRSGGRNLGILTLLLDSAKGFLPVWLAARYFSLGDIWPYLCGLAAVCGHIFPVWLKFKGGKGVATTFGVILALMPLLALLVISVWGLVFGVYKMVSLASVLAAMAAPIFAMLIYGLRPGIFMIIISLLILLKHKSNIQRILTGQEHSLNLKDQKQE